MAKLKYADRVAISDIVAGTRQWAAMSQGKFGEALGVTAKQVSRYESAAAVPPESRLKRIFHIGLKVAAPFIQHLPGYVPAILTVEAIREITEAVRRERETDKETSESIDKLTTQIADQTEAACKAREAKEQGSGYEASEEGPKYADLDSIACSTVKFPSSDID